MRDKARFNDEEREREGGGMEGGREGEGQISANSMAITFRIRNKGGLAEQTSRRQIAMVSLALAEACFEQLDYAVNLEVVNKWLKTMC